MFKPDTETETLQNFDIRELIFQKVGLRIPEIHGGSMPMKKFQVISTFFGFCWTMCAMGKFFIANINDLDRASEVLIFFFPGILILFKSIVFVYNVRDFVAIKQGFDELLECVSSDAVIFSIWQRYKRRQQLFLALYDGLCFAASIAIYLKPLLVQFWQFWSNGTLTYELAIGGIYPFGSDDLFNYVFALISNWFFLLFCRHMYIGIDGVFSWLIFTAVAHFEILRYNLASLTDHSNKNRNSINVKKAKDFLRYHQKLVELVGQFDQVFCKITFVGLSFWSLQFCFYIYRVNYTLGLDFYAILYLLTAISVLIVQILCYCCGAQQVQDESEEICDAIYLMVPWEHARPETKFIFRFCIMRAQRPITLTGYFFTLNRYLLVKIFQSAFSLAALAQAVK